MSLRLGFATVFLLALAVSTAWIGCRNEATSAYCTALCKCNGAGAADCDSACDSIVEGEETMYPGCKADVDSFYNCVAKNLLCANKESTQKMGTCKTEEETVDACEQAESGIGGSGSTSVTSATGSATVTASSGAQM